MAGRSGVLSGIFLGLCSCGSSEVPPEATLRSCMGNHARDLASAEQRRPTFDEAKQFARLCGAMSGAERYGAPATPTPDTNHVNVLACAYSEQWDRCGLKQPTD